MNKYLRIIHQSFSNPISPCVDPLDHLEWARFGFYTAYHLYQMTKSWRFKIGSLIEHYKEDGSPSTALEVEMENFAKQALTQFFEPAIFLGEESGGEAFGNKYLLVIDPIDGTRSFLSGFETYSITLGIVKDRIPIFSIVCAPYSGDLYFRVHNEPSMVLQIPGNLEDLSLYKMPIFKRSSNQAILVNLHPSLESFPYLEKLFKLWLAGKVSLIRSVSGSPSLQMVKAAKTGTFYINTWGNGPTYPFDLVPALHIIKAANCQAFDRNGNPIDPWDHKGFYIVGPGGENLEMLLNNLVE